MRVPHRLPRHVPALWPNGHLQRFVLAVVIAFFATSSARAATNITIIASGTGNLDSFLSASNGTITTANDSGDTSATLSKAALQAVGAGVSISISADTSITFQDLGTLSLLTGAGQTAAFQTTSGAVAFANASNTISTGGGGIQFTAGGALTVCSLNSNGGDVTLIADNMSLTQTINAGTGAVTLKPFTTADAVDLGASSSAGILGLPDSALGQVTAGVLRIGSTSGGSISVQGSVTRHAGYSTMTLLSASDCIQSAPLSVAKLALHVDGVLLSNTANDVDVIAGSVNGNFGYADTNGLTVGTVDGIAGITTSGVGAVVTLQASTVIQSTGSSVKAVSGGLQLIGFSFTLGDSGNNVATLSGSAGALLTYQNAGNLTTGNLTSVMSGTTLGVFAGQTISISTGSAESTLTNTGQIQGNSGVSLTADIMSLGGGTISTNTGATNVVTLKSVSSGRPINIDDTAGDPLGELRLATTELHTITTDILRIGDFNAAGNLTVKSALTGVGWQTLSLLSGGSITQSAAITVTNLNAAGLAAVSLQFPGNAVTTLAGASEGLFQFANTTSLTVGSVDPLVGGGIGSGILDQGQVVTVNVVAANGLLTVSQPIVTNQTIGAPAPAGATIVLIADQIAIAVSATLNSGTGGLVELEPYTTARTISLGGANSGTQLGITDALLSQISAGLGVEVISNATISFDGIITTHAGYNRLIIYAASGAIVYSAGSISVANLALNARSGIGSLGAIHVTGPINVGFFNSTSGNVNISSAGALTLNAQGIPMGNLAPGGTTTISAASPLTISVSITNAGDLNFTTTETITETGSPLSSPDDDLTVGPGVTLNSTGGAVNLTSADNIIIGAGASITGFSGVNYVQGNGDNDHDGFTAPTISKVFGAASIPVGGTTTLTFTLTNPNPATLAGLAFTDNLPSGLIIATPNNLSNTCGGSVTATSGTTSILLGGGSLGSGGGATCTVKVDVSGNLAGIKSNSTSAVTSTSGGGLTGNVATATLTVVAAPSVSTSFLPTPTGLNGSSSLTFHITNPDSATAQSGVSFTDTLPAGLVVATPPTITGSCGAGTITATAGSGTISLSGAAIAASSACNFAVPVTSSLSGSYTNSVTVSSTNGGTGNTSTTSLIVASPPSVVEAFGAVTIPLNTSTSLTFTITNPNNNGYTLNGLNFTDTLPGGLVVASLPGLTSNCGGTATATGGSGTISLTGGSLTAGGTCQVVVNVTGTAAGAQTNSVSVSASNAAFAGHAISILNVAAPPVIAKAFGGTTVPLNSSTSLTFTITNPNTLPLSGLSFTDTLPGGLVVSTPNALTNGCGGSVTATAGSSSVSLTGGSVGTTGPCTVVVNVTGVSAGVQNNTTGAVGSTGGGTGNTASASVTVAAPPTISEIFGASTIPLDGSTSLTFTIFNPSSVAVNGLSFTDALPAGLVVAATPALANTCGGTATAGSGSISLSGGSLSASGTCTVVLNVTGITAGTQNNTTGAVSSTEGGAGNVATASITVVAPPSIAKAFQVPAAPVNQAVTLSLTITNPNAGTFLTGVSVTDTFPAGLVVSSFNALSNSCNGTATATPGSGSVSLTAGTIPPGSNCTVLLNVQGATVGTLTNVTGAVSSTEGGTGNPASATLTVDAPPAIAKAFGAASIPVGGTTTLTFTIANPNPGAITGVSFSDSFPGGVLVATANGLVNTCGGTVTAVPSATSVQLTGGSIAANSNCTVTLNVTGTFVGAKNNITGNVGSNEGGPGNTALATLDVLDPPLLSNAFGASTIPINGSTTLTFSVTNSDFDPLSGISFTDSLPAGLVVATPNGLTTTCNGTVTATAGSGSVSLTGASLGVSSGCTVTVNVTGTTAGVKTNVTGAITSTEGGTGSTATATTTVVAPPTIAKAFGAASIPVNGSTGLTFTLTNPNASSPLTAISFTDVLPSGLVVAASNGPTSTCAFPTVTAATGSGSISVATQTLVPGGTCTVSIDVTGTTAGVKNNVTGAVSSPEGGTGSTAAATVTVVAPPTIAKVFGASSIPLNGSTSLTFTITNPNGATALSGVSFNDALPAGLAIATPNALTTTCGGTATATAASSSVSLTGGSLSASGTCTVAVNVTGTTAGAKNNVTGAVGSVEGGAGNIATATMTVVAPPAIAAAFSGAVCTSSPVTLTLTITNPNTVTALSGAAFTDALPAGMTIATPNALATTCGGTATATAGSGSLSLTGGSVPAAGSCIVSVNVATSAAGTFTDTTGAVTSANGGSGPTASATLTVSAPVHIAQQPLGRTAAIGSTVTVSVAATGTITSYQWRRNTIPITGATAASYTIVSASSSADGSYDVVITGPCGSVTSAAAVLVVASAPHISTVTPPAGPLAGGQLVTISGTNLSGPSVAFDSAFAPIQSVTSSKIVAITPPHAAGTVDVTVKTAGGTATATAAYRYVPPPSIAGLSPNSGTVNGGDTITITGTDLDTVLNVQFGNSTATITGSNPTSITVVSPPHDPGTVTIVVTTAGGTATATIQFTYKSLDLPPGASVIPVVGSAPGALGSFFRTAIQIYDPGTAAIAGNFVYHAAGAQGSDADPALPFTLASGVVQAIPDFLTSLSLSGVGSADLVPTSGKVPLTFVRVFNDAGAAGTTGMTLDPVTAANALQNGDTGILIAPADPANYRFNIGIRSLASGAALQMTVRSQDGTVRQTVTKTYLPVYFVQQAASDLLGTTLAANDAIAFTVNAGSAVVYGSATDNRTQDPSVQIARRLAAPATSQWIVPVIGSTAGSLGSFFRTALQLHNPWTSNVAGTLVFHAQGTAGSANDPAMTFNLAPGQTQNVADVLPAIGLTGIGSADLNVTSANAPVTAIRIFNDAGAAGTVGMTIDPVAITDVLTAGDTGVLIAPADPVNFRFNIGVRTLDSGASMQVLVRGQDGTLRQTLSKSFAPNTFVQMSATDLIGSAPAANDTLSFVINTGSAVIYGTSTDNRSQDPSYQLAKKSF